MRYLIFLLITLISCSSNDIFKNSLFTYSVIQNNSSNIDTLFVKVIPKFFYDKLEIEFKYKNENNFNKFSRESDYTSNNSEIAIKSPIGDYLDYTEYLPYPQVNLPLHIGDSIFSEHTIPKNLTIKSKVISGYQKVVEKKHFKNNFIDGEVWVIKSYNANDKDYSLTYYFSKKYGFIYLEYNLSNNKVKIELIDYEKLQNS